MLTDTQYRTAKSKDKPYKLSDGKGLYLSQTQRGEGVALPLRGARGRCRQGKHLCHR